MRTPTAIVLALLVMQPRLQAEHSIAEANRVMYATGNMQEQAAAALARSWQTAAQPGAAPKATPDALVAHGFAVRKVPKKRAAPKA